MLEQNTAIKPNVEKIVEVLEKEESLISGLLCNPDLKTCGHEGRCAVGALLFHAGVSNEKLQAYGDSIDDVFEIDSFVRILGDVYGLTYDSTMELMEANDENGQDQDQILRERVWNMSQERFGKRPWSISHDRYKALREEVRSDPDYQETVDRIGRERRAAVIAAAKRLDNYSDTL